MLPRVPRVRNNNSFHLPHAARKSKTEDRKKMMRRRTTTNVRVGWLAPFRFHIFLPTKWEREIYMPFTDKTKPAAWFLITFHLVERWAALFIFQFAALAFPPLPSLFLSHTRLQLTWCNGCAFFLYFQEPKYTHFRKEHSFLPVFIRCHMHIKTLFRCMFCVVCLLCTLFFCLLQPIHFIFFCIRTYENICDTNIFAEFPPRCNAVSLFSFAHFVLLSAHLIVIRTYCNSCCIWAIAKVWLMMTTTTKKTQSGLFVTTKTRKKTD